MNYTISPDLHKNRRRERFWVITVFILVVFFGFLEGWFFKLQPDLPLSGNIFLFALINLNVMLLLLLAYLVMRNIVKLIFERKRNILGHKLRTRLVIAFVGLTIIPTLPLFWVATQFIFSSLDYWFSHRVELSLEQAVTLSKDYLAQKEKELGLDLKRLKSELGGMVETKTLLSQDFGRPSAHLLDQYKMDGMYLFDSDGELLWHTQQPEMPQLNAVALRQLILLEPEATPKLVNISPSSRQEGLLCRVGLKTADASFEGSEGELLALRLLPQHMTEKLNAITTGYEDYLQLKLLHVPLKRSHFITFSVVTLLTIFSAVWFGFYLAKSITVPIQALVSATQSIAEGDLNVELEPQRQDEIGMLISSFNDMVRDLRESREQLAGAYTALQQSHLELEDRRRYMEIVLKNIAAGVVSVDADGRIMTMNKSAEATFGLQADEIRGQVYSKFLQPPHLESVKSFIDLYRMSRQPYLEQQVQVMIGNRPMVLFIKVSILRDDRGEYMGVVVVLDDLTELEKAQRMAAWREVARRIAHEIKNPLTPIQLSAQRLRRKYSELLNSESSVLDECTRTIVEQVDHMKHLVNEFSKFARLPRAQLTPTDLTGIVEDSLTLYRHNYPHVTFTLHDHPELPPLRLDKDQFKQVLINLIDNAIHALDDQQGEIGIRLFYDPILKIARLECSDTGHGLSAEDKLRMFEPYYSKREKGTGLGLAIVASIIADHNGFVRVRDNAPQGTVMIIELPG
jgi:two-component system, NtrC family, nitrogen regulation sensor histidine kinase NtrY